MRWYVFAQPQNNGNRDDTHSVPLRRQPSSSLQTHFPLQALRFGLQLGVSSEEPDTSRLRTSTRLTCSQKFDVASRMATHLVDATINTNREGLRRHIAFTYISVHDNTSAYPGYTACVLWTGRPRKYKYRRWNFTNMLFLSKAISIFGLPAPFCFFTVIIMCLCRAYILRIRCPKI